jgi:hypothetical protein
MFQSKLAGQSVNVSIQTGRMPVPQIPIVIPAVNSDVK